MIPAPIVVNINVMKVRLNALRTELARQGLDGFIIPRTDEYQGEFLPPGAERVAWLTGFTGSAGVAVVLKDRAVVMTDGRYQIQVRRQVDGALFETGDSTKIPAADWLAEHAAEGSVIGYDPRLHTVEQLRVLEMKCRNAGLVLKACAVNPVDAIWTDRPAPPESAVAIFPEVYAGRSAHDKRQDLAAALTKKKAHAYVFTLPDSIAWLLNIRGGDVPHTPVALSYAVLHEADGGVDWFINPERVPAAVKRHLGNAVRVVAPEGLEKTLTDVARAARDAGRPVLLDYKRAPVRFRLLLEQAGAEVRDEKDICIQPRACKNAAEIAAMENAHIRDGAAMARFLFWLEQEAPKGTLTEMDVGAQLETFRAADPKYRTSSFESIVGFGANGAIVHYRAVPETNAKIVPPGLLLVDSGGQYEDGTTDITRTVAVGAPDAEMRDRFTRVLRGHIALARAKFPDGATGAQLDTLARFPLWEKGLDYAHGTGHGVGCYLSVHEEAASISPRGHEPVRAGMIISNEPGYYKEGGYGIRIESLVLAEEAGKTESGVSMLSFRTLTFAPIERRMIMAELLTADEKDWLNAYHASVFQRVSPLVSKEVAAWLKQATAPV